MTRWILLAAVSLATSAAIAADSPPGDQPPAAPADSIVWKIDHSLESPKGVCRDPAGKTLYISNMVGVPDKKEGKGWIAKADLQGKILDPHWVEGLNTPRGLHAFGDRLWVTAADELLAIDIKTAAIAQRITVPGAKFLNDLAIADDGQVYACDAYAGKIFVVKNGKASLFAEEASADSPNGLVLHDDKLVVASWGSASDAKMADIRKPGRLFELDLKTKKSEPVVAEPLGNLDGLEMDGSGGYYVADNTAGKLFHVAADGTVVLLFKNPHPGVSGLCLSGEKTLIVALTKDNAVVAYNLDKLPQ